MIDHLGFSVSDYARSKAFYEKALMPLGYKLVMEVTAQATGMPAAGFGSGGKPDFWIGNSTTNRVILGDGSTPVAAAAATAPATEPVPEPV